ncbi:hypothetical protein P8C59_006808 [Phyllachora maydis]|uniref:Uncharacterized protein n=1 Tax=Phyllachora maydis TaxID=1825666 RepID=A0AAD9I719_9PEZI|nr:hypothetical protein P8C59_006808 [Phyllachora maydis]
MPRYLSASLPATRARNPGQSLLSPPHTFNQGFDSARTRTPSGPLPPPLLNPLLNEHRQSRNIGCEYKLTE